MSRLILASTSRYRRELLGRLGLPFDVVAPGVDEAAVPDEAPDARAIRLAEAKARAARSAATGAALVIGSDQVAAARGRVLDKPGDADRCREQLRWLSGGAARFHTACALIHSPSGRIEAHLDTTTVHFRALSDDEIDAYVSREQPFDCAGGFKVEGLGISLFEKVESVDPTALIGLPLIWLAAALRRAGLRIP